MSDPNHQFPASVCPQSPPKAFHSKIQVFALPEDEESFGNHHSPYKNYLDTHEITDDEDQVEHCAMSGGGVMTPGKNKSEPRNLNSNRGRNYDYGMKNEGLDLNH